MRWSTGVLLMIAACFAAQADEVYRWVDEKGQVHYGDTTRRPAEKIMVNPDSGGGPDPEVAKTAEAREAECQRKRAQLEGYRKASAIKETDALGRTREYTEEERQALLARTEQEVRKACDPQAATAASAGSPPDAPAE